MNADEIKKRELGVTSENGPDQMIEWAAFWLQEIAYQLAILNETVSQPFRIQDRRSDEE